MNCRSFEKWLDDGCPGPAESRARQHAAECDACRGRLAAMEKLESLLSRSPAIDVGPEFADRVMARVETEPQVQHHGPYLAPPEPEWWIAAWAEPAAAMALVLGGVLVWQWNAILAGISRVLESANQPAPEIIARFTAGLTNTASVVTLAMVAIAFTVWISVLLFRLTENWIASAAPDPAFVRASRTGRRHG